MLLCSNSCIHPALKPSINSYKGRCGRSGFHKVSMMQVYIMMAPELPIHSDDPLKTGKQMHDSLPLAGIPQ